MRREKGEHKMIALLFMLFACAMALAWYNRLNVAHIVFGATLLFSVHWNFR
jgi:hypothetical protein